MLDMDVSIYMVHRALLSHMGEQITLQCPILYDNPAPSANSIVWMNYILEKVIWMGYYHEYTVPVNKHVPPKEAPNGG